MSDASVLEKEAKTAAPAIKHEVKPLAEMEFGEIGVKQNTWFAISENSVSTDDVLEKGYWAHVAAKSLRPFDKIHIMNRERSWYGELVVFAWYTGGGAVVRWIAPPVRIGKMEVPAETSEFEIFDAGLGKDWSVKRKDGRVMMENYKSRQEAHGALSTWLRAQGKKVA